MSGNPFSPLDSSQGLTVAFWKLGMKQEFDNHRSHRAMDGVERRIPKRWTEAEDDVLYREARSQLATGQVKDWNRIAAKLPGRTNKDCRKRWINKVCGSLKKGAWDEDEDERLREAVRVHGQKWAVIANIVGLRSPDRKPVLSCADMDLY
jgi:hypothetical protein